MYGSTTFGTRVDVEKGIVAKIGNLGMARIPVQS